MTLKENILQRIPLLSSKHRKKVQLFWWVAITKGPNTVNKRAAGIALAKISV